MDSRLAGESEIVLPFLPTVGKLAAITLLPVMRRVGTLRAVNPTRSCQAHESPMGSPLQPQCASSQPVVHECELAAGVAGQPERIKVRQAH